jgi:hypothetical protein
VIAGRDRECLLMEWSGHALAPPAIEAGQRRCAPWVCLIRDAHGARLQSSRMIGIGDANNRPGAERARGNLPPRWILSAKNL